MSGSNSGWYQPPQRTHFDCEKTQIQTTIASVDLTVLKKHNEGDILELEVNDGALKIVDGNGEVLGAVVHLNTNDIRDCMANGHAFKAKIVKIVFPQYVVVIKRKSE